MADYYAEALDAAKRGDAEAASAALQAREQKMNDPNYKGNGGGTSMDEAWANVDAILSGGAAANRTSGGSGGGSSGADRVATGTANLKGYLDQWLSGAQEQAQMQTDYAVDKGVKDLQRAEEDAQQQFQTQRDQIAIDEAKALDNQALYAEARGDKGGIGKEQYGTIQNTAAKNRLAVSQQQTKLSTDTARQIADLRAQGEFQKADALLTLSQQYLQQLMSLEQWSMEFGLSVDQFNESLKQWQQEFELKVSDVTGQYKGQNTFAYSQYQDSRNDRQEDKLSSAGSTLLSAGIMPSDTQLAAMGLTKDQAKSYITAQQLAAQAAAAKSSSGGGSGGSTQGSSISALLKRVPSDILSALREADGDDVTLGNLADRLRRSGEFSEGDIQKILNNYGFGETRLGAKAESIYNSIIRVAEQYERTQNTTPVGLFEQQKQTVNDALYKYHSMTEGEWETVKSRLANLGLYV